MRNLVASFFAAALFALPVLLPAQAPAAPDDVAKIPSCRYCGMDRERFGHSRMLVQYDDNSEVGTCSIRCLATELANSIDKTPRAIMVGDYKTRELIDAESATWVIGGEKPGVMTSRAKWAFAKKEDAQDFVAAAKGSLATFDEAMKAAYEDLYADTKAIRERRKVKRQKMTEGK